MARSDLMKFSENIAQQSQIQLASHILQQSSGMWESKRRYYTLKNNETQEVVSVLTNQFLEQGSPELLRLAELHQLDDPNDIICGIRSSWESTYLIPSQRKPLTGTKRSCPSAARHGPAGSIPRMRAWKTTGST